MSCPLPCMADFDFENPTFDPDGHGIDNDESFDLPDAIMDPLPLRVQQKLYTSGNLFQSPLFLGWPKREALPSL